MVSRATPTPIRIEVPANGKFRTSATARRIDGSSAMNAMNSAPGRVMRRRIFAR
ncbi:hypothetical protein D3C83_309960 [compost metagenome]